MKILAAIAVEPHQPLVIEEVELTEDLGPHEVLVKNVASGICHSDMSMRDLPHGYDLMPGMDFLPKPVILGHEGSGIVQKVGTAVTNVEPGDHVVMAFHSCGECHPCESKREQYCPDFFQFNLTGLRTDGSISVKSEKFEKLRGSYHQQSSFATYSLATDRNIVKVPKEAPLELMGPLGCGFLTGAGAVINRLKPGAGSSFAAFGAGPLGFAAMYMAKKAGCEKIIAVDLHDSRLELAREFGATHVVNASRQDSVEAVIEITGHGADFAYEATGAAPVMSQMIAALGPFGHGVISGVVMDPEALVSFKPAFLETGGKTVSGILMGDGDMTGVITQLADAVISGDFPIEKLVTYYDFKDINQAIADSESGKSLKCILKMPH